MTTLSITIDFSKHDCVSFTMYDFIEDVLKEASDNMNGTAVTPASDNFFEVNDNSVQLDDQKAAYFHIMTTRLLFACNMARRDIQVAVAFLCTRVKSPNINDYCKLTRLIKYL